MAKRASLGITPACAGKRATTKMASNATQDHPRMCGEKRRNSRDPEVWQGSPPRMRGKGGILGVQRNCPRITPAYAGKSITRRKPQ